MPDQTKTSKTKKKNYIYALGRRRTATARVRLYAKKEDTKSQKIDMIVNDKPAEEYFPSAIMQKLYAQPLRATNTINRFKATVKVEGSGKIGQLGAVIHGLARALVKADEEQYKSILRKRGFLTRDSRMRERRKVGTGGRARRQKQSPKR